MIPSKPLKGWQDFALAYNPGVAFACEEIINDPQSAYELTNKGHLVAVITNGTAVLGMGDIGPLAAKPVMEGKSVLIKYFSGLDSIDLEISEKDPHKLVEHIVALAPSFGAINLEDIKAPECFIVEHALRERLNIPVFHDDQHGTAIVVCAAILNGLYLKKLPIEEAIVVVNGAGAGALACLGLLHQFGVKKENIWLCDQNGIVHTKRDNVTVYKAPYARDTLHRTLEQALKGADVFLGLSKGRLLTKEMIAGMNSRPLIFALANPVPEILPEEVYEVHPDALVSTGRSDYPNQINNILCFPYIFRGALEVRSSCITEEMKRACVQELQRIAQEGEWGSCGAYEGTLHPFGTEYFIPKAFDPRLRARLPIAIAKAAINAGVSLLGEEQLPEIERELILEAYESLPTFCRLCLIQSVEKKSFLRPSLIFSYALDAQDCWSAFKGALLAVQGHHLCSFQVVHPKGSAHVNDTHFPQHSWGGALPKTAHLYGFSCLPSNVTVSLNSQASNNKNSLFLLEEPDQKTKLYITRLVKKNSALHQAVCVLKDDDSSKMTWEVSEKFNLPSGLYIQDETLYIPKTTSLRDMIESAALVIGTHL